ncbi:MAG: cupin domain-containing protein [Acidiferrobacterales bacterium]
MIAKLTRPEVSKQASHKEFLAPERLFIIETWNSSADPNLSIARARVKPGVTTALHYLAGIDERYLITSGGGVVEVDGLPPTVVSQGDVVAIPAGSTQRIRNTGNVDLIFYCICTPRFRPDCYHEVKDD